MSDEVGTPLSVATAYLAALSGDHPDAVADLVSEDFVNEHQNALGTGCRGRDEYRRRLPGFFAAFVGRTYDVTKITVGPADEYGVTDVVARYRFRADVTLPADDDDADVADGDTRTVAIDIPGVMWIEVRGSEVIARTDTWDAFTYFLQSGDTPPGFVKLSDGTAA